MSNQFWYRSGSIPEAIRLSKQQSKLFLVYVTGNDKDSHRMDEYWNIETVKSLCEQSCVALKLQADSDDCKRFSAIYPVMCIPSAYFIDSAGKLVEALLLQSSSEEFVAKVEYVINIYLTESRQLTQSTPEREHVASSSSQTDSSIAVSKDQKNDSVMDGASKGDDVPTCASTSEPNSKSSNPAQDDSDGKVPEEVSNQLKQYRNAVAKEFEKEAEERKRALERERLIEKEAKEKVAQEKRASRESRCRLQFRLPDGAALIHIFKSDEFLSSAVSYIKNQNLPSLEKRSFTLSQIYPRKNYTVDDYTKTFQELEMIPGASLIVIPSIEEEKIMVSTLNNLLSLLMFILLLPYKILLQLWDFLVPQSQSSQNEAKDSQSGTALGRLPAHNANVRRRYTGNMVRLSDTANDDDEDDNATWNGNSTQQM